MSTANKQDNRITEVVELERKPTPSVKGEILRAIFRDKFSHNFGHHFDTYFDYYETELGKLNVGRFSSLHSNSVFKSHTDIIFLIRDLRARSWGTYQDLWSWFKLRYPTCDDEAISQSIYLVLRLWLMINFRDPRTRLLAGRTLPVTWEPTEYFSDVIKQNFGPSKFSLAVRDGRLQPSFSVIFMVDICGLQLEWTNSLADHLRLDRREKRLSIFCHKAFIAGHLDTYADLSGSGSMSSPLPKRLLIETVWTLNLLFPHWDAPTNKLLKQHKQSFHQIGPYEGPPTLNLVEFEYWGDRLSELYDVIFLSPPVSWAQLWKDRRNPQQFWTFWLALFILALTLLSTLATLIQTCASVIALIRPP